MNLRYLLLKIMAVVTGAPRYVTDVEWSSKSWTHNVFRLYELSFGRRWGIRPELTSALGIDEKGRETVTYQFHSFEAIVAHIEARIRGLVPVTIPVKVWVQ